MTRLHNIFIVGAAKAGTTSLYYLLGQHPDLCTPVVKEPNYFSNLAADDITGPGLGPGDKNTVWTPTQADYHALYKPNEEHNFKIDASVSYLYSRHAAKQIAQYDADAKIIIVLRNPVKRAWSHYKHLVRDNREEVSFEQALAREEDRIQKGWEFSWHLAKMGCYFQQVKRYLEHFDAANVRILIFEDMINDLPATINKIANFVGLPSFNYQFEQEKHNVSGVSRSKMLSGLVDRIAGYKAAINKIIPPSVTHGLMQKFRSANTKEGSFVLSQETSQRLKRYYHDDIQQTAQLIEQDLSRWL